MKEVEASSLKKDELQVGWSDRPHQPNLLIGALNTTMPENAQRYLRFYVLEAVKFGLQTSAELYYTWRDQ